MKKLALLVCFSGLFVASAAQAKPYGTAGCGLGSILFGSEPGLIQVIAATFNGTSANQTFAISSGTSNCDSSGGSAKSVETFATTNRSALAKDIARGQGETLASLSKLAGCRDDRAVGRSLQRNFTSIFPSSAVSDRKVGAQVVKVMSQDKQLACGNLG